MAPWPEQLSGCFKHNGPVERHKSPVWRTVQHNGTQGAARTEQRDVQYRLRLRLSRMRGFAGADHDGGYVCSCSRNDNV